MDTSDLEKLKYPIGRFQKPPGDAGVRQRREWIEQIAMFPKRLSEAVEGLSEPQLDTPYRDGGWTVRQLVHHLADSHLNSQIRFRWALTENTPTIKTYDEKLWAELPDAKSLPIQMSVQLLSALHERWTGLLTAMRDEDFNRRLVHPESGEQDLSTMVALYAWHGRHHLAQVEELKKRKGW